MSPRIRTISMTLPFNVTRVNCYVLEVEGGCLLIDTGSANGRAVLEIALASAGCGPGRLKLIVLTHGDFDHTGNAAYLRHKLAAAIAMHADDAGVGEHGDMFWNRKTPNAVIERLIPLFFGLGQSDGFTPDLLVEDGRGPSTPVCKALASAPACP